jgi:hypothetical protein
MCDYSLHEVASRPARLGDKLMTTTFAGTCTRGFCAVGEPNVAVCLQPGTELAFREEAADDSLLATLFPRSRFGKLGGKVARFRQINKDQPSTHHDALEFENGTTVLLTHLRAGQHVTVLQLPPQSHPARAATEHRHPVSPL